MVARRPPPRTVGPGEPGRGRTVLVVTPYSLETNPYVRSLVEALEGTGLRVQVAGGRSPLLLWRAVSRHGIPGVVHLQWQHPYLTADRLGSAIVRSLLFFIQLLALRVLGTRLVWTVHNLVEHERRHVRWELAASRLLARAVHAPIAHCGTAAAQVAEAFRIPVDRVEVVPHGLLSIETPVDREAARAALGLAEDDRLLLNFGRIRRYKGIGPLLDAFARIEEPRLRLVIVGHPDDPDLADALTERASRDARVQLRPEAVSDEELGRLLSACDAVALPYRASLTSGAAVLAAGCGRPVVAPRLGCLGELPNGGAILYDPADERGLENALETAATAPLAAMGEVAREHVARHPWPAVAERTVEVYRGVSGSKTLARMGL